MLAQPLVGLAHLGMFALILTALNWDCTIVPPEDWQYKYTGEHPKVLIWVYVGSRVEGPRVWRLRQDLNEGRVQGAIHHRGSLRSF